MFDLSGKRVLVFGVASEESIAWAIAQALAYYRAEVHIVYQQRFRSRVMRLVEEHPHVAQGIHRCDVMDESQIVQLFREVGGPLHGMIHAIGYAPAQSFIKPIHEVSAEEFSEALLVSAHSLLRLTQEALPSLVSGGSIVTLTYLGGQRVVPFYRLMGIAKATLEATVRELAAEIGEQGIRVNAISAGPIRTLSASALPMFSDLLERYPRIAPLHTSIDAHDVAGLTLFLSSDLSAKITGQIIFVDAGYSILGAYPTT